MSNHDQMTNGVAAAAASSPLWLPSLEQISTVSAQLLPVLGVTWLIIQIVLKLYSDLVSRRQKRKDRDDSQ